MQRLGLPYPGSFDCGFGGLRVRKLTVAKLPNQPANIRRSHLLRYQWLTVILYSIRCISSPKV